MRRLWEMFVDACTVSNIVWAVIFIVIWALMPGDN